LKFIAKILLGLIIAYFFFGLTNFVMAQTYLFFGRPYNGSIVAGSIYSFFVGLVSVSTYHLTMKKITNQKTSVITARTASSIYILLLLFFMLSTPSSVRSYISGIPTYLMVLPWLVFGLLGNKISSK